MPDSRTLDIVIPSYRLTERYLLALIYLPKPAGWQISYYIVVDNPRAVIPSSIAKLAKVGVINLLVNERNLGASDSRNRGIDAGQGEWILFIDDDVQADEGLLMVYTQAIDTDGSDEIGYIGVTDFPTPVNGFTRAIYETQLDIFKIAETHDLFTWGVTANMMYNRRYMGDLRFSSKFPKNGGGEDADLPLRICTRHQKLFKCLKEARVVHPWWNNGTVHVDRFIRYGIGKGYLMTFHPSLTWYNVPNLVELLILLLLVSPLLQHLLGWQDFLLLFFGSIVGELVLTSVRMYKEGIKSFRTASYYVLLTACSDLGIVWRAPLHTFMKRINVGYKKLHNFQLNKWKIIKITLFVASFVILFLF